MASKQSSIISYQMFGKLLLFEHKVTKKSCAAVCRCMVWVTITVTLWWPVTNIDKDKEQTHLSWWSRGTKWSRLHQHHELFSYLPEKIKTSATTSDSGSGVEIFVLKFSPTGLDTVCIGILLHHLWVKWKINPVWSTHWKLHLISIIFHVRRWKNIERIRERRQ